MIHHTNNTRSIWSTESHQKSSGFAMVGYHFLIDSQGKVYEGRPLEVMGSHAGEDKVAGPMSDPDWGSVGIALIGDFHHIDDYLIKSKPSTKQLESVEKLVVALRGKFSLHKLLLHKEVQRAGVTTVCPGSYLSTLIVAMRDKLNMNGAND